jgi:O-antigen ligase
MSFWIRITEYGLYLTLFISILMFGAGFVEGYTLLAFLTILLSASLLLERGFSKSFFIERMNLLFLFILTAWFLLLIFQLLVLPQSICQLLSPKLVELYQKFGTGNLINGMAPLSIAWENGFATLLKYAVYIALFFVSYGLIRDKTALKRLNFSLVLIAVVIALLGLAFLRIKSGTIYGVFSFERAASITPYVNKNHYANLLVMTLPVTLGFLFFLADRSSLSRTQSFNQKILWFFSKEATLFLMVGGIYVIELFGLFRASSRGGLLGFVAGLFVFLALLILGNRKRILSLIVLAFIGMGSIFLVKQIHPLLYKIKMLSSVHQDHALSFRLSNWLDTVRIFFDFPWVGIGAGGFNLLFPFYKSIPEKGIFTQTHFSYVENEFLQGLAETGIIGSALLLGLSAVLIVSFLKKWFKTQSKTAMWLCLGMMSGCFAMLAHSLVDYPMHIPANMAVFAVLSGAVFRFGEDDPQGSAGSPAGPSPFLSLNGLARMGGAVLMVVVMTPLLWQHYRSTHLIDVANEHFSTISKEKVISQASLLGAHDSLLKERQLNTPERSEVAFGFGKVYLYLGFSRKGAVRAAWFEKSEVALLRAIKRYPFNASYHYTLGWLHILSEQPEQARPFLKNAMELEPQNPFYRFKCGENEARLGNMEVARQTFQETIKINIEYIEQILWILTASPTETKLEEEEFQFLLPDDENRSVIQYRMTRFLESRQNYLKSQSDSTLTENMSL